MMEEGGREGEGKNLNNRYECVRVLIRVITSIEYSDGW